MYNIKCPKCGQPYSVSMPQTYITCNKCGTTFNAENGSCRHGKRKGQCSDSKCEFNK